MAKPKITLSASRDIPFDKLRLSQANVRRIKAGVSIEELAEDIARRTLLASLTVRPMLDEGGAETGFYEIPAGGRRFRALERLVKQKRLARTALVPCVVREAGLAEEDSLAENIQRAPLHPLDQFRAFLAMRERGVSEEEIAAAFFVSVGVVRQRLRLAAVSPKLLEVYAEDGVSLDQLMAFTVNPDHDRQEAVWEALSRSPQAEPYSIRRMLTEQSVRACDRRARYVGLAAYEDAGGVFLRDLFQADDGGWLQDAAVLDRLASERLQADAEAIAAEGWRWLEVATEFSYGHTYGLRRLTGVPLEPTDEETAAYEALRAEVDALEAKYAEADDLPPDVDARLDEIETAIAAYSTRPVVYDADEIARAGAFVSIDGDGRLRVERGFIRPEDEAPVAEPEPVETTSADDAIAEAATDSGDPAGRAQDEDADDESVRLLPDRLIAELTAHRTLALRDALAGDPDLAVLAVLHALCLKLFYRYAPDSCLEIDAKQVGFAVQGPGLADSPSARSIEARHAHWANQLPKASEALWLALGSVDADSRRALFAHCASLTVNAVDEAYCRRPRALAHADRLAAAAALDMAAVGWRPTVELYLGRVTKSRILAAVEDARGANVAHRIAALKKAEMASEAERLLEGSGWLPEPLRTPGQSFGVGGGHPEPVGLDEETAVIGGEPAIDATTPAEDTDPEPEALLVAAQ